MADELWRWTASELAQAIRLGRVSSREAVTSCLSRLDAVNPYLNAVVEILAEPAIAAADHADRLVKAGEPLGPLHGVPVTIKSNTDQAGCHTANGVVAFKDVVATADSPPVANWHKAGAIVIGRTNVPPLSLRWYTDNDLYGRTLNPWDAAVTPGGSTGGGAAALAAGICPLTHGNDSGGSIRYPAYACGVAGIRPTLGRVPRYNASWTREPTLIAQLMGAEGPLARSIGDLRLGLAAMATYDPRDPWWVPAPPLGDRADHPVRVALFSSAPGVEIDPAVAAALRQAAAWLGDAGYRIEEAAPPRFLEAADLWLALLMNEGKSGLLDAVERFGDAAIKQGTAGKRAAAPDLDLEGLIAAQSRRSSILREWLIFFERFPLLLMPVSWQRPFPQGRDLQGDEIYKGMLTAQSSLLAINVLGLPGLAVPTGLADGLPVGVQLVAGRFQEERCLSAGEIIEARAGMRTPIDPLRRAATI